MNRAWIGHEQGIGGQAGRQGIVQSMGRALCRAWAEHVQSMGRAWAGHVQGMDRA